MHPRLGPCVPVHIMDSKPSTNKSSQDTLDPDGSDRSFGEPIPSTPAVTNDTVEASSARQPQNRVFTLFKRLPTELRILIWEFACSPPGPRIHFLEPKADSDETHNFFYFYFEKWVPEAHWEISERTKDPCFQWSGRELFPSAPKREMPSRTKRPRDSFQAGSSLESHL